MKLSNLVITIIIIILIIAVILFLIDNNDDMNNIGNNTVRNNTDEKTKMKILYSYGLFSDEPMSEKMLNVIRKNQEITGLPYEVIGKEEVLKDLRIVEYDVPGITEAYHNVKRGVAKSDIARMVSLFVRSGHYSDLDVEFQKAPPMTNNVVLYTETFSLKDDNFLRIANYALSSPAKHPFIKEVLKEIVHRVSLKMHPHTNIEIEGNNVMNKNGRKNRIKWSDVDVLNTTGPDVITSVYHKFKTNKNSQLKSNSFSDVKRIGYVKSRQILKHRCAGSWRDNKDLSK